MNIIFKEVQYDTIPISSHFSVNATEEKELQGKDGVSHKPINNDTVKFTNKTPQGRITSSNLSAPNESAESENSSLFRRKLQSKGNQTIFTLSV